MNKPTQSTFNSLSWLLEPDEPGVRYLALRDLLDVPCDDAELKAARKAAHRDGPIAAVLGKMEQSGFWVRPGPGYSAKYRSTVWALILLAQLGASIEEDERIERACAYLLDHALTDGGQFTPNDSASGTIDCLQGNLCWTLVQLGCDDARLKTAVEWMARSVTGEGLAPATDKTAEVRYYADKCGPTFACGWNNRLPRVGRRQVMLAFSAWPMKRRTPLIKRGRRCGFCWRQIQPRRPIPSNWQFSRNWWKFGSWLYDRPPAKRRSAGWPGRR
jgi:hypothetical protein